MIAEGTDGMQRINAVTQNSRVGNGGSSHRVRPKGEYVEHGHHALMRISAFRDVGGYDPTFKHNEDAELDHRLRQAGYRIWLTPETLVTYHPRDRISGLLRQYFNHGRGRARNMRKHRIVPALRQAKVMLVLPAVLMLGFVPLHPVFALPALLWCGYCLLEGTRIAIGGREPVLAMSGPVAMMMHLAWSAGFWSRILGPAPLVRAARAE
jgi:succinoglycan biosynthesis protein ExoA